MGRGNVEGKGIKHREAEYRERGRKRGGWGHGGKTGKERSPKRRGVKSENRRNMRQKWGEHEPDFDFKFGRIEATGQIRNR